MSSGKFAEKLEHFITESMREDHVPGLSIAIVKDGRVVYARGFGARCLKDNAPATPDTLCGVGSCTKSFTAMAIMQLAEQGKLSVKDPVGKHLPEFKVGKEKNPITIHNLLTHSSGIPGLSAEWVENSRLMGLSEKWVPFSSFEDFLSLVNDAKDEVAAPPGNKFFYSNEGYMLLGMIIERVSEMPYESYIREKILKPLKMSRSTFLKDEYEKDEDVMTPYLLEKKDEGVVATPTVHSMSRLCYANGGLMSSARELATYLVANMYRGTFGGANLLDPGSMDEMHRQHIETPFTAGFGKMWYGYGWYICDLFGHLLIYHYGSTGASSANLSFLPDLNVGVACACNVGDFGKSGWLVPHVALALLMDKDPFKEISVFEIQKKMSMLVGEYATYKGIVKASVSRKSGLLFLESNVKGDEFSFALIPESDKLDSLRFYVPNAGGRIPAEFVIEAPGKVDLYIERNRFHKIK